MKNTKKNNIWIITQCNLPVPAVRGGAVETLIGYLIEENDKYSDFDLTVVSIEDELAINEAHKYKHTEFKLIKEKSKWLNKVYSYIYKILKRCGIYIPFSLEFFDVLKLIKYNSYSIDFCVYEAGPTTQIPLICKYIPKQKIITHLHWDGLVNEKKCLSFKYLLPVSQYIGNCWRRNRASSNNVILPLMNCTDISLFNRTLHKDEQFELKQSLSLDERDFVVIFVGRIVKEKGILELLNAIDKSPVPNLTLMMIGSSNFGKSELTDYELEVEKKIANSNKKIIKVGYVPQKDLYRYYSISDIAIMPSMFDEPAGMVCIEAQAFGIPLIATKTGGLPEYASSTTLLVNKDNIVNNLIEAIATLYFDPELRKKMITEGRNKAKMYSTGEYYNSFKNILKEIGELND